MKKTVLWMGLAALASVAGVANAHEGGRDFDHGRGGHDGRVVFDDHFHHDHYYPARGYVVAGVPRGALAVGFGRDRYWFSGGVWYRPYGPSFRVVVPPFGIVIPLLPSAYVTLSIGGMPYYYANGIYYTLAQPGPGYVVVQAPPGADNAQVVNAPAPAVAPPAVMASPVKPEPVIYPRNGQSAAQLEADRQDCNRWATTQPSAMGDASVFSRAVEACMDARGYTLR